MVNKYGIYQTSNTSCIFYKEDEDGNQSTFNLVVFPETEPEEKKSVLLFVDNEHINQENFFKKRNITINEIIDTFGGWASDAPMVFEFEAKKSMSKCLRSFDEE